MVLTKPSDAPTETPKNRDPGFQQGVAVDLDVNQSTVSRTLITVSEAICSKRNNWITFPNTNDLLGVAINEWASTKRMPSVIGAIDCTHGKITKPRIHGDEYVNIKGICSIKNVQATCNAKEIFTSVDATWPGSVHVSRIWRNSLVHRIMYNNVQGAALLGDEGYGTAPWLLTPFKNPTTPIQENYNLIHAKERCVIERCFGQLKRRFPMLQYTFRLKIENIPKHIVSAFVLHNISKHLQDPYHDFDPVQMEVQDAIELIPEGNQPQIRNRGTQRRNDVALAIFRDVN
ncbi:unnamed protein product [Acanthoscelides obtectus]|uniref:DDE Tnp4 domain-containing protein n=1 Tax=Acanthoscelides obtectus TaxID=200917 RepID=A0A9P0LY66_ACAOB|nr:unnamed protein product [Acanthoscelides obtectus]CAK1668393.1 Putative nuclease HARBI1 [Acanthoscelides obtectus]